MSPFRAFRIHNDDAGYRSGIEAIALDDLNPGEVVALESPAEAAKRAKKL